MHPRGSRKPALISEIASTSVFLVLPAYNECDLLRVLLSAARQVLGISGLPYAVIVVDDGSQDATALVAGEAARRMPVVLIRHEVNRGLAVALRTGIAVALQRAQRGDVIVTMDADNTHSPWLIPGMVAKIRSGRDVVIASRYQPGAVVRGVPYSRRIYSMGARWLLRTMFPMRGVRDYTCSYRAYSAGVLHRAVAVYGERLITEAGFSCMVDLLLKLRRLRVSMCEVPLELHYERRGGGSKMLVWRTIRQTLLLVLRRRLGFY